MSSRRNASAREALVGNLTDVPRRRPRETGGIKGNPDGGRGQPGLRWGTSGHPRWGGRTGFYRAAVARKPKCRLNDRREVVVNAERNGAQVSDEAQPPVGTTGESRSIREPQWPRVAPRNGDEVFFLRRLRRLMALNRYCSAELPTEDPEMRLLRHAIYSTYRDCLALGVAGEAREILAQLRSGTSLSASPARLG